VSLGVGARESIEEGRWSHQFRDVLSLATILFHLPLQAFWELILGNLALKKYLLSKIWDDRILGV
jgi:hypothetical protein